MSDQPPSYQQATGSSGTASQHLNVPSSTRIPTTHRRSMEDEARPLPEGWVRQYDHKSGHQYFVDTKASPPRSIWHHPYDDITYLRTLPSDERERLEEIQRQPPSREDIINAESDTENPHHEPQLPPRPSASDQAKGPHKWGRKLKDKMTGTSHEQRLAERKKRDEEEQELYRRHLHIRQAMSQAMQTGEPQLLGKDEEGRDVYIEPPRGGPYSNYGQSSRYYNPYNSGPYTQPNARFIPYPAPQMGYGRPGYGYGGYYGGGMGMGMGMPMMGGLLGGALLGGLLF